VKSYKFTQKSLWARIKKIGKDVTFFIALLLRKGKIFLQKNRLNKKNPAIKKTCLFGQNGLIILL